MKRIGSTILSNSRPVEVALPSLLISKSAFPYHPSIHSYHPTHYAFLFQCPLLSNQLPFPVSDLDQTQSRNHFFPISSLFERSQTRGTPDNVNKEMMEKVSTFTNPKKLLKFICMYVYIIEPVGGDMSSTNISFPTKLHATSQPRQTVLFYTSCAIHPSAFTHFDLITP